MADQNLSEAFAWAEKELGRELWPRERQFIRMRGWARSTDFEWDNLSPPENGTERSMFDARLIRCLMTEEIPGISCRNEGVELLGLWIERELDLSIVDCGHPIRAIACNFQTALSLEGARVDGLDLSDSVIPSLDANHIQCRGSVKLAHNFKALGVVNLSNARIDGELDCAQGNFAASNGIALDCSNAIIGSHVYLDNGFRADGLVTFVDARIFGKLLCSGSTFTAMDPEHHVLNCDAALIGADLFLRMGFTAVGKVSFVRAEVKGDLECNQAKFDGAVTCEGVLIRGGFFWKGVSGNVSTLNLTETKVGRLTDDTASWACVETPALSGFRYDSIQSDITVKDRLALLDRKWERNIPPSSTRKDFDPQPYSQLAKVYETMGHRGDAAKVRLRRDVRLASARLARAITGSTWSSTAVLSVLLALVSFLWSQLYRATFGFGYAPFRAFGTALVILLGTYVLAENTYQRGEFAPASPVVLASPEWLIASAFGCPGAQEPGCIMPLRRWEKSLAYRDYETFSPALYALDLFLPLDTLAQEESWAPSKDRGPWGWTLYWGRWLIQLSGWLLLTTAAAVFSGVLGKKD